MLIDSITSNADLIDFFLLSKFLLEFETFYFKRKIFEAKSIADILAKCNLFLMILPGHPNTLSWDRTITSSPSKQPILSTTKNQSIGLCDH